MLKIQCNTCQMILSLPDNSYGKSYRCEYCKALVRMPENTFATGITIKDFTILKKSAFSSNDADIFITHQISLDRPAMLELHKKNTFFDSSTFFKLTQSFASLNHKCISAIYGIGQEEKFFFRSYEYGEGTFFNDLPHQKIQKEIAANIYLNYLDFILYFLNTEAGKSYILLPEKAVITPEYKIKIIPSGLNIRPKSKNNTDIFRTITAIIQNIIIAPDTDKKNDSLTHLSDNFKEFIIANINMTDNMSSNIINGKEKNYFMLYDKLKKEVSNYF